MATSTDELKASVKSLMKRRGRTYAELAERLGVSLPTVKRILGPEDLSVGRLLEICEWLDVTLSDLETLAGLEAKRRAGDFTAAQEEFLAKNPNYLTYFAVLHSGDSPEKIARDHGLTAKSTELYLLRLEKLELLHRDSKGRVRLTPPRFPNMTRSGPLIRSQYRQLIEKFGSFFQRRFAKTLSGEKDDGPTWMTMYSGKLSRKTSRDWQEKLGELQKELERQARLEEKLDAIEDECYFVVSHMHTALEPSDPEVGILKETMGRIVNL